MASRASKNLIYERIGNKIIGGLEKLRDKIPSLRDRNKKFQEEYAKGQYRKNFVDKLVDRVMSPY